MRRCPPETDTVKPVKNTLSILEESRTWLTALQHGERTVDDIASFTDQGTEALSRKPVPRTGAPYGDDYAWVGSNYFERSLSPGQTEAPAPSSKSFLQRGSLDKTRE